MIPRRLEDWRRLSRSRRLAQELRAEVDYRQAVTRRRLRKANAAFAAQMKEWENA